MIRIVRWSLTASTLSIHRFVRSLITAMRTIDRFFEPIVLVRSYST